MLKKSLFKKPNNILEMNSNQAHIQQAPEQQMIPCPGCKRIHFRDELKRNIYVCFKCGYHLKLSARTRLNTILDKDSFIEEYDNLTSTNIISFPSYTNKLKSAQTNSGEKEAVVCGKGRIESFNTSIFSMEPGFLMGSMGTAVGEKITLTFENATEKEFPVIGIIVSGGARMQEGIFSLMQMAKVSAAVKRHSDNGLLFIALLTDPTTGGVIASFAMQADIIIAEPGSLIGFAGPRVIEQTIRQKLPPGFQRAEFLLQRGFLDSIVSRQDIRKQLAFFLKLHETEARVRL